MRILKKKRLGFVCFAVAAVLLCAVAAAELRTSATASADGLAADPLMYTLIAYNGGSAYKVSVQTAKRTTVETVIIPPSHAELPVVEIADNGFVNCTNLEIVVVPETVVKVGMNAFVSCSKLKRVGLPSVTTIGANAFGMCPALERLYIPDSVTTVGATILRNNTQPSYLEYESASSIGSGWSSTWNQYYTGNVVYGATVAGLLQYREILDESQTTAIGYEICEEQGLSTDGEMVIYSDYNNLPVLNICPQAFEWCSINTLTIKHRYLDEPAYPVFDHAINLRSSVFTFAFINNIDIQVDITQDHPAGLLAADGTPYSDMVDAAGAPIEGDENGKSKNVFLWAYTTETITLPNSIDAITESMFNSCMALEEIKIAGSEDEYDGSNRLPSVDRIGVWAFSDCIALENIFIPSTVLTADGMLFNQWGTGIEQTVHIDFYEDELPVGWNPDWNKSLDSNGNIIITEATIIFKQPVILDAQGGTGGTGSIKPVLGSLMPTATAPTRTGYDFLGYYSEPEGLGYQYYTAGMVSARYWDIEENDITLYAHWEEQYFQINFVENPYVTFVSASLGLDGYGTFFVPYGTTVDFSVIVNPEYSQSAPSISAVCNNPYAMEYPTLTQYLEQYYLSNITDSCDITVMEMQENSYTVALVYNAYVGFGSGLPGYSYDEAIFTVLHGGNLEFQAYMKDPYSKSISMLRANGVAFESVNWCAGNFILNNITEDIYITADSVQINQYTVILPLNEYVVYSTNNVGSTVSWGETFSFTYTLNAPYTQSTPQFSITGGWAYVACLFIQESDGVYSITIDQAGPLDNVEIAVAPMQLNQYTITVQENNQRSSDYSLLATTSSWCMHGDSLNLTISVSTVPPVAACTLTVEVNGIVVAQFSDENGNIYDYTICVTGNLSIVVTLS